MSTAGTAAELPKYRCHKDVWALKIEEITLLDNGSAEIVPEDKRYASFIVPAEYMAKHQPLAGGYFVVYKDGYRSFSPAEAFEDGYTLAEKATTARDTGGVETMLDNNFRYHPPKGDQTERYGVLRDNAKDLAKLIATLSSPSREQSLALTKLEEAIMWANAGIARNE